MYHKELGEIVIKKNARSKSFIARIKNGVLYFTVPVFVSQKNINQFIEQNKEALLQLKKTNPVLCIDTDFTIDTEFYCLSIKQTLQKQSRLQRDGKDYVLHLGGNFDFDEENTQEWLRKVIEETLIERAKEVFPPLLMQLAKKHRLEFSRVSINRAKRRWGSCSSTKSINISCYTLLLPLHLMEFVLLHELTHTIHMNHSEKFWSLLDRLSGKKVKEYNAQLKSFKLPL